jgi:hypothetical protein
MTRGWTGSFDALEAVLATNSEPIPARGAALHAS